MSEIEIEQQIFEKMKSKDFGESMCDETKLNILKWTIKQLRKHDVGGLVCLHEPQYQSYNNKTKIQICDKCGCITN
jgi:hypothetical protein